jgi:outer membrane protein OmpA-like peptidoglycan-associated protein
MNGVNGRPTIIDILTVFMLSLIFLMGCTAGRQPALEPASPSSDLTALGHTPTSNDVAPSQPALDWSLVPAKSFDAAVMDAATSLLSLVELPAPGVKHLLFIDSPMDGMTGVQSVATRRIEARVSDLVRKKYLQFSLQPFTPELLNKSPLVLLGTLTPVDSAGLANGKREGYRVCLALADLESGTVISKEISKAQLQGVNHTPTAYFQESPAWMQESFAAGYVQTCEKSKPGDRIQTAYRDGLPTQALLSEATALYESGNYKQALERFAKAADGRAGDQLRARNGIYLANLKLGRGAAAAAAFGDIVEYGLAKKRLAINFLFQPGRASFAAAKPADDNYPKWVKEIARRATQSRDCLEIVGHTSRSGPESLNERLSLQRAEFVRTHLEAEAADLAGRVIAYGAGSRENLVGTGKDDVSDALDRRVAFQVISCAQLATQTAHR